MAPAPEKTDSVYDFLYVDLPRIQIFNSQFSQYGHITELTRSTKASSEAHGGFDLKLAKMGSSEGEETSVAKKYNTQFVSPLLFLDNAKDMLVRDLSRAGIGQFVLVSGSMSIIDLMMLKDAWNIKAVKQLAAAGVKQNQVIPNRQQRRQKEKSAGADFNSPAAMIDFIFDLIKLMPHGMQAQIYSAPHKIWSALDSEFFVTPPSDLSLNHGSHLPGVWNVVGILDGIPGDEAVGGPLNDEHSLIGNLTTTIQPLVRQMLGRPPGSFGLTPLLIFREVNR